MRECRVQAFHTLGNYLFADITKTIYKCHWIFRHLLPESSRGIAVEVIKIIVVGDVPYRDSNVTQEDKVCARILANLMRLRGTMAVTTAESIESIVAGRGCGFQTRGAVQVFQLRQGRRGGLGWVSAGKEG
jgi:hypothetical protein